MKIAHIRMHADFRCGENVLTIQNDVPDRLFWLKWLCLNM